MSLTDLIQDPSQLSGSNTTLYQAKWTQILPSSAAITSTFSQGVFRYLFSSAPAEWWVPSRTFIRLRLRIHKLGNIELPVPAGSNVAPSYLIGHNLFQAASFTVNGKVLCDVQNYLGQVGAFQHRVTKSYTSSRTWQNVMSFASPWLAERLQATRQNKSFGMQPVESFVEGNIEVTDLLIYKTDPAAQVTIELTGPTNYEFTNIDLRIVAQAGDVFYIKTAGGQYREFTVENCDENDLTTVINQAVLVTSNVDSMVRVRKVPWRDHADVILMYQPPLPVFDLECALPGGCINELVMNPMPAGPLQYRAVESTDDRTQAQLDYQVTIMDNSLFVYNFQSAPMASTSFYLDFLNFDCRSQAHVAAPGVRGTLTFDVPPSTYVLGVAFQTVNLESSCKNSPTMFKCDRVKQTVNGVTQIWAPELSCTYLQVQYAGQTTPQFDPTIQYYNTPGELAPNSALGYDGYNQRWIENQVICQGFDNPGESYAEWLNLGPLFLTQYIKIAGDQSTRVVVNYNLAAGIGGAVNVLVFPIFRSAAKIDIDADGKWQQTDVTLQ